MKYFPTFLLTLTLFWSINSSAQQWIEMLDDPEADFYDIKAAFDAEWAGKRYEKGQGYKQYKRWEHFMEPRVYPSGKRLSSNLAWEAAKPFANSNVTNSRSSNWSPLGPFTWSSISYNPGLGRVNVIVEDPNDSNILYVGVPSGGCWKSMDAGATWQILTDDLVANVGVSGIVIDPVNTNIIYLATGDGDGADTYNIGVLKSTDGGLSWAETGTLATNETNRSKKLIMHPVNQAVLFLATTDGLFRTSDGGMNWLRVASGNFNDIEFKPGDPNTVYATTNEFLRSLNGGLSFTQFNSQNGLPGPINRKLVEVSPANPELVYILAGNGDNSFNGLYKSTDSGSSFTVGATSPNIFSYPSDGSGSGGQIWYDLAFAVSETDPDELFAGGINIWKSNDGGASFQANTHWVFPATLGYVHADIHYLKSIGSNLYCGSDGGIFKSTDRGVTWQDLSAGLQITQFYRIGQSATNANLIVGGAQDNGTIITSSLDGLHIFGADGGEAIIDYTDDDVIYLNSQNGGLRRSLDGGNSIDYIAGGIDSEDADWVAPMAIHPTNPEVLYHGRENLWRTDDRGDNWTKISNFSGSETIRHVAVAPSNSDVIYVTRDNKLHKTADGGSSWNLVAGLPVLTPTWVAFDPNDENRLWVTFSGSSIGRKVFVSQDGGTTWVNYSINLPNVPTNCIVYENGSSDGLYVGTDIGVFYINNQLSRWQMFSKDLPRVVISDLEIFYPTGKIRAATYGRGIWESNLYQLGASLPTSSFTAQNQALCNGQAVEFRDYSVNAAPGWEWHFPGGTPSTSTDESPSVVYPVGMYTASLITSNANGTDTTYLDLSIQHASNELNLELNFDSRPEETSWEITDFGGTILREGTGYDSLSIITENICLPDGCYILTIKDISQNGMCCVFGAGSYTLTDSSNTVLATGGQFSSSESTTFCVNEILPLGVADVIVEDASCNSTDGSVELEVNGGYHPIEYSIDGINFQSSNMFGGLSSGLHSVLARDSLNNTVTIDVILQEGLAPLAIAKPPVLTADVGNSINFFGLFSENAESYFWDFGDGNTSTHENPSNVFNSPGVYDVVMTAQSGNCSDADTVKVYAVYTGTKVITMPELSLFPNPFDSRITLEINNTFTSELSLNILNSLGQIVYQRNLGKVNSLKETIDLKDLSPGVYFVRLKADAGVVVKKLIKQH